MEKDAFFRLVTSVCIITAKGIKIAYARIKSLSSVESQEMEDLNKMYKNKFDFPFVTCSRLNNESEVLKRLKTWYLIIFDSSLNNTGTYRTVKIA